MARQAPKKSDLVMLSFRLPLSQHYMVKARAADLELTVSEYLRNLLQQDLPARTSSTASRP